MLPDNDKQRTTRTASDKDVSPKITQKLTHRCARLTGLTGLTGHTGLTGLT